jgi:hypothetical protein
MSIAISCGLHVGEYSNHHRCRRQGPKYQRLNHSDEEDYNQDEDYAVGRRF